MHNVHQQWDPLKVCVVGKSFPPDFYSSITNARIRNVLERISQETEEDFQKLISLLKSFDVKIIRPEIENDSSIYIDESRFIYPPMMPCDTSIMVGDIFYSNDIIDSPWWSDIRGDSWPRDPPTTFKEFNELPINIINEIKNDFKIKISWEFSKINEYVRSQGNRVINIPRGHGISSAEIIRCGKDLYFGTNDYSQNQKNVLEMAARYFPNYRHHVINTGGHIDSVCCVVKPGLVVSISDGPELSNMFPDWEIFYLPAQGWTKVDPFQQIKKKNQGKWWVLGEESNEEFIHFIENYLSHWIGYVEETVFDVNMIVVDEKNVICHNYNKELFSVFERHNITPHIVDFRHRYFWDGGLHCITSDIHREGIIQDWFPNKGPLLDT